MTHAISWHVSLCTLNRKGRKKTLTVAGGFCFMERRSEDWPRLPDLSHGAVLPSSCEVGGRWGKRGTGLERILVQIPCLVKWDLKIGFSFLFLPFFNEHMIYWISSHLLIPKPYTVFCWGWGAVGKSVGILFSFFFFFWNWFFNCLQSLVLLPLPPSSFLTNESMK